MPAMAPCQPTNVLNVATSSRASRIVAPPLPQCFVVVLEAQQRQHDKCRKQHKMSHAFDGIGFAIVEVDRADNQGEEDHHGLHRGHRHLERLAGVERHRFHHRHRQDHRRQRRAHGDVDHRLHAVGQSRPQRRQNLRRRRDRRHQDRRDHRRCARPFQAQVEGLGHHFGQGADDHHAEHQCPDTQPQIDGFRFFVRDCLAAFFRVAVTEKITVRPDLHAQKQGVKHDHRTNGERRIEFPTGLGDELWHHHGNAHGGEDHHAVATRRVVVVGLFAVLEPAHQRSEAEDAVDVEQQGFLDMSKWSIRIYP